MAAVKNSRVLWTIPFMLIVVLFCPLAYGKVIYVDDDAVGANDGTSWENAYNHLQDALADADSAEKPVEIRVSQGIYKPDQGEKQTPGDREASFRLINGVTIKGGYAGLSHEDPNDRDVAGFTTNDLEGEWFLGGSDIQGNHTWNGLLVIDSAGAITGGTLESSEGLVYTFIGGDLAIDSKGKVTGQVTDSDGVATQLTMQMDKSKGIIAGEGNATIDDEDGVFIFIRKSSGFTTGDLAGEWFLGGSDIQGKHTWDGLLTIDSTGLVTGGTLAGSDDGPVYTFTGGDLAIDATGKVTGTVTDSDGVTTRLTMQMDKSKGIIAGEGNATIDDEDGVFVFVRRSPGYETILSGDLEGNDIEATDARDLLTEPTRSENSYHVVTGSGTNNAAVLDGFAITGGNADGGTFPAAGSIGSGMYNVSGSPTLSDCAFRYNSANSGGAGMSNGDNSNPVLTDCSFVENFTAEDGAGMLNYAHCGPILIGCSFIGNLSDDHGGGMLNADKSNPVLINCVFEGNSAGTDSLRHDGGGMYNTDSSPKLSNCIFSHNSAGRNGGGMHNRNNSNPTLTNCTFNANYALSFGGGVHNQDAIATLLNCIMWANGSDQIYGDATVSYSNVEGGFNGEGNMDADPRFADPSNGDFHLRSQAGRWDLSSQTWVLDNVTSPCIDAGDPDSDWTLELMPHGERINMGAFGGTPKASMSFSAVGTSEGFETGDFSKLPWEHGGNADWTVTHLDKLSGKYSTKAGAVNNDESTTLQVKLDCMSGNIAFYCKVSSETGFDYLQFYIDGVEKGKWSGEEDWIEVSFSVTAGVRTFKWTYSKDGSVSEGDDTAWIDDIALPVAPP